MPKRCLHALILLPLALAGCRTQQDALSERLQPWIGRNVRDFAIETSIVPQRLEPNTYVFTEIRQLGVCRRTVLTDSAGTIRQMVVNNC